MIARWTLLACVGLAVLPLTAPASVHAQIRTPDMTMSAETKSSAGVTADPGVIDSRWEFSLYGLVGRPYGYIRVGENANRGNRLRLHEDLGITVSEAVEASAVFHLTPRDAVRGTFLNYFLRGRELLDRSVVYNGEEFKTPGHISSNADFYRLSLAYERTATVPGALLTGGVGLTYVHLNPSLTGHGHGNSEDFYQQELPVPIVELRFDIPTGNGFGVRASIGGGGLPRVDSGRKEGGTVYLEQIHGDAAIAMTYAITRNLLLDVGPHLTYFFQHEKSHEDNNAFELIDYGVRAGVTLRF